LKQVVVVVPAKLATRLQQAEAGTERHHPLLEPQSPTAVAAVAAMTVLF
jgi:hypothetical protein